MHADLSEVLAFVALAIMVAPIIAGWVRMPGLIGFVIAGAVVGPFVLNWLHAGSVDGLGKIGLLYLMFLAGLEIDLAMFKKHRNGALLLGVLGFLFPFALGMWEAQSALGMSLMAAALLGSIFASHTLVTLPDVREAGLSGSRAATTVVGATILTDTLALIVLALTTAEGGSMAAVVARVAIGLAVISLYTFVVLPWVGKRFFRGAGQTRTLRFAYMLFAFASAGVLAEFYGIEGLVGAFLAGLGVNPLVPKDGPLMERVDFFGESLFVPAFLIYVGTKLDPAVIVKPSTITMALGFLAVLFGGKALAGVISGLVLKFKPAEWGLTFGMTIPQAAATLAATLVGAEVGLLNGQVVNAVVFVVLVSIVMGSLLTRFFARRIEMPSGEQQPLGASVLVGLTDGVPVDTVVGVASAIALAADGVVMPLSVATKRERDTGGAEATAHEATAAAARVGADAETRVRYADSYSMAILEAVIDRRASALVTPLMTSRSPVSRIFGDELERVGRESPVPVVAVRPGPTAPTKVIIGLDSRASSAADRFERQLVVNVGRSLAQVLKLPVSIGARTEQDAAELGFKEVAEVVTGPRAIANHPEIITPGSVLVVPASLVRRMGPLAADFAHRYPEATLVVVAGPYRLRTSFGVQSGGSLGLSVGDAALEAPSAAGGRG